MGIEGQHWRESMPLVFESLQNGFYTEHYFNTVVEPALRTLADQIDEQEAKQEDGYPFVVLHLQAIEKVTVEAFALTLQSLWERQLRRYLGSHKPQEISHEMLELANWGKLQGYFRAWRPIGLHDFDSFVWLDLLQELGNACRHGDGRASRLLFEKYPGLWPNWPPRYTALPGMIHPPTQPSGFPSFRDIVIPKQWLQRFTEAIGWFWEDIKYLYSSSLPYPDKHLVKYLDAMKGTWSERAKEIT